MWEFSYKKFQKCIMSLLEYYNLKQEQEDVSMMWEQKLIETPSGTFGYFVKGSGQPLV